MNNHLGFLRGLGKCHRRLLEHSSQLWRLAGVREVIRDTDMYELGDSWRLEVFVDAELETGEALSWGLEITVTETAYFVEAAVRKVYADGDRGEDRIKEIGEYRYETETECLAQLQDITERLCSWNPLQTPLE